jgi:hypothetical protein
LGYFAPVLVGVWGAGLFILVGSFIREVRSPRGGTGVGFALPGACFTFAAPFLWAAATSGESSILWIYPSVITTAGVCFLVEALRDGRQKRREDDARLAPVQLEIGRR